MTKRRQFFWGLVVVCLALGCPPGTGLSAELPAGVRSVEKVFSLQAARLFLRADLKEALESRETTDALIQYIYEHFSQDPAAYPAVILAYYGTFRGLQAKFAGNPQKKLAGLVACLKYLDQAVQREDADLEVFFLRYSSLHHLPPLLGVPKKRVEDIETICALLLKRDFTLVDKDFQAEIIDFMLKSKRLSPHQRESLMLLQAAP